MIDRRPLDQIPTVDLVKQTLHSYAALAESQIELFESEMRQQLEQERRVLTIVGGAVLLGLTGVLLLLIGGGLAVAESLAADPVVVLAVMGAVLAVAGLVTAFVARRFRVKQLLPRSLEALRGEAQWTKSHLS